MDFGTKILRRLFYRAEELFFICHLWPIGRKWRMKFCDGMEFQPQYHAIGMTGGRGLMASSMGNVPPLCEGCSHHQRKHRRLDFAEPVSRKTLTKNPCAPPILFSKSAPKIIRTKSCEMGEFAAL